MDLLLDRALEATADAAHDKARVHLNALTRLAPDFAEAWNASATLHFVQRDYGHAVDDISRALALEPRHFNALAGLGIILERVERPGPALDAWLRVKALYPDFHGAIEAIKRLEPIVRGKEL
jgi:tetratricopeptide (TPR) repeat protein